MIVFLAGKVFPGYGSEAYPAGRRFPVKREEVSLNEKESPR